MELDAAFGHKHARAVALLINSPGGSPVQSALIAGRIRALAEEKKLPVLAFVEDVAASGGYWLACAADEIFADPSSIVGSIGVVSAGFGFQEAIAKLGIERRVHTTGEHKALLDPFRPERAEDLVLLRQIHGELQRGVAFRAALRSTTFYQTWREKYGDEAWAVAELEIGRASCRERVSSPV